ncbi:MAG: hypothetical protein N2596_05925 [Syntrophorhabdaceae bacterium]|nr:hypothetical protein [Syntrophorhabdaceae bacterium]
MKTIFLILCAVFIVIIVCGISYSLMDKAIIYGGAGEGRVIFDHKVHSSIGISCNDCHTQLFETQKKALFTMDDHFSNRKCFSCHNGKKAFNECEKCHRKI